MNHTRSILNATTKLRSERTPFLCATVVGVRGSSYRRPGARLIATTERRVAGCVSGGCLEKDLLRSSWWRTANGPVVVRYDSADEETVQAKLGCGGEVDVLLERAGAGDDRDSMVLVERAFASERVAGLATVYRSTNPRIPVGTRFCLTGSDFTASTCVGEVEARIERTFRDACEKTMGERTVTSLTNESYDALVEAIVPPPHVFVFGTGIDALPVVESIARLGWNVTIWEPSARIDSRARFAGATNDGASLIAGDLENVQMKIDACDSALAIVMGHHVDHDRSALSMLLQSNAGYIGVLGPRHRTATLAAAEQLNDPRLRSPVGLDLGAETPEEIALSITAEMLAAVRHTSAGELRTRPAIHSS